jgi:tRNA-dihydrouridine synthase B
MLKIGNSKLKSPILLAPMAGISDLPFRLLNRKFGCELAFVEMINVRSISHKSRRTRQMLSVHPKDKPLGIQILGTETNFILQALDILKEYQFDLLDFNAACPVKKVTRRGEGASLLKEPKKLYKLLKLVVDNSQVPVTVKIRSGWDNDSINAKSIALAAQDAGVKAVTIHGRTKTQGYSGEVNYKVIREVKKALAIPVIASGDAFSAPLVKKMFDETGCDAVAIARGAFGNPWIFNEAKELLETGKILNKPERKEIITVMIEHLNGCIDFYGERIGVMQFRKFFAWYTKGMRRVRALREKSSTAKTKDEMAQLIEQCQGNSCVIDN